MLGRETSRSIPPDADAARLRRDSASATCSRAACGPPSTSLRVTGRLLDAETGAVLWSQAYDEDLRVRDLFAIQDDVAPEVATAVASPTASSPGPTRGGPRPAARRPGGLRLHAAVLRLSGRAESGRAMPRIRTCLERAVARYPSYATAWAMLSMLYLDEDRFGVQPAARCADRDSARARGRPPGRSASIPRTCAALQALMMALFFTRAARRGAAGRRAGGGAQPERHRAARRISGAASAKPATGSAAWPLMEQALARNPGHSGYYNGVLAQLAYMQRDYERAEALIRQVSLEKFPLYHFVPAIIYAQLGMKAEAAEARDAFLQHAPDHLRALGSRDGQAQLPARGRGPPGRRRAQGRLPGAGHDGGRNGPPDGRAPTLNTAVTYTEPTVNYRRTKPFRC